MRFEPATLIRIVREIHTTRSWATNSIVFFVLKAAFNYHAKQICFSKQVHPDKTIDCAQCEN